MSFVTKDDKLLEKYNEIWRKFRNISKKEFRSEPLQNKKYLKAEIKSYNQKINTKFYNKKIPKEVFQFIFSSVILIDSVFRPGKNYFPRVFLGEQKYVIKEKKMPDYITDDIEPLSDSDRINSDEENSNEKNKCSMYLVFISKASKAFE